MTPARRALCILYAGLAVAALIGTWSQNVAYFGNGAPLRAFLDFLVDAKVNASVRSIAVDIAFMFAAASTLMIVEARRVGVRFAFLYVLFGLLVAISVTFPLFLIAREVRLARGPLPDDEARKLRPLDVAGIVLGVLFGVVVSCFVLT